MSEYMDYFQQYIDAFLVRDNQTFMTVAPPVFFPKTFDSIAIRIEKTQNGVDVTDCHCIEDYWEEMGINEADYQDRIKKICDSFDLYREDRCFCMHILSDCTTRTYNEIGYFLQAMALLGNIYI